MFAPHAFHVHHHVHRHAWRYLLAVLSALILFFLLAAPARGLV